MTDGRHLGGRCAPVVLAIVLLACGGWPESAAAIAPQYQCSATYDLAKSYCEPVEVTPWRWSVDMHYGTPVQAYFLTEGAALAVVPPRFVTGSPGGWCTDVYSHTAYDTQSPTSAFGIDYVHRHTATFDATATNSGGCVTEFEHTVALIQARDIKCPDPIDGGNWSLQYEAGNSATPYCAIPWNKVRKRPQCDVGKGNPCDLLTGAKRQVETDYVGAGAFPLAFKRTYDGAVAYNNHFNDATRRRQFPAGIGWSATYFQFVEFAASGSQVALVAFRPDGKRRVFKQSGSDFLPDVDISDRVVRLTDGAGNTTGWQYINTDRSVESYDTGGRLTSIVFPGGATHMVAYPDPTARYPSSVSDSFGRQLLFDYDTAYTPRLEKLILPGAAEVAFSFDAKENMSTVTASDGTTRTYHYEATPTNGNGQNLLTGITDESGTRYSTYAYSSGRVTSSEHAGAVERYTFTYNSNGNRVVTDPLNKQRTYGTAVVHGTRRLVSSTEVCMDCGESKALGFDDNGNVNSRIDFNDRETRYSYELSRNLEISRTEAYGTPKARTTTTAWHSTFRLPTQIDEPNRRTTFAHDANGNVLTRTVADLSVTPNVSRTWTYTYNSHGKVLTTDGPRTDVSDLTTYTYYGASATCAATVSGASTTGCRGQVETVTDALSHVTTYDEYNAHGQALKITDPNGVVTTLTYDARQRLTSRGAGGETTTFAYWPTGLLKQVTLADSSFLECAYDAAHRLTEIEDNEGNRIVYTLDDMDNRVKEETFDPSSYLVRLQHRAFNTLNQLWKEIGSANTAAVTTTFGYDVNGNQTSVAAPLSRNTASLFDELNRLKQTTDPISGVTLFGYDANDNLTSVTDPRGKVTSYLYNGFGDLKQLTSPDTGVTDNVYDSGGNLATSTDARGKTGTRTYDALNRVTQLSYPDQTITYSYDTGTSNKGRLMQVTDGSGSTSWTYTSLGRVASRTQVMSGMSKAVGYGYNSDGQLTTLTTPSGQTITYAYANNRIAGITVNSTTLLSSALYDPFGPVRQWTWGNASLAVREFDQDGNVDQIDSAGLRTYAQDDAFRITDVTDTVNSALSWAYAYDLNDRLTSASKTGQSQSWTYDGNGNRLTEGGSSSSTYTISSTNNRLSSVSGALSRTYTYDAAGNTTGYAGFTFGYDDAGRLTSVSGSATATYAHNALGQRVKKTAGGVTTYFVYDEAGHLIGEYDGSGALIQETVWMEDIPVATLRSNGGSVSIFYVHTDHLNTPRRISRPSDDVIVWRWDSDAFGTDVANQDPDGDATQFAYNLHFPGQYFDAETGQIHNHFRDYDPEIGRYLQSDPIGVAGGIGTYTYVVSNPASNFDPMGLCWSDARAGAHFFGGGGDVTIDQIGCRSQLDKQVSPERAIWRAQVEAAARKHAMAMACGTVATLTLARSVGVNPGAVFWIGGFSLRQSAYCRVGRNCGASTATVCMADTYWYVCSLNSKMHDPFEHPSDFDNSARSANPDFWDKWNYGGTPFAVDGSWGDVVRGGGTVL